MKGSKLFCKGTMYAILIIFAVIAIFPVLYTFTGSFKTNSEIMAHPENFFPESLTFDNYKDSLGSGEFNIFQLFANSVIYTSFVMFVTLASSTISAYVFERGNFVGKGVIFAVFSSLMFISMGSITVYALFEILSAINIPISLHGLMLIKVFGIPVANIFIVRGFIKGLPKELDEAAMIDGCGFVGIFFRIILPLLKPVIATVAILAFQASWNEYLMPAIFTNAHPEQRTLMVGIMSLKSSGEAAGSWNLMLAGSVISLLPIFLLFICANKYFIGGLTEGAVKG